MQQIGVNMKTLTNYDLVPNNAIYLGSEYGDGTITEILDDMINEAIEPIRFRDDDGMHHYFDLVNWNFKMIGLAIRVYCPRIS